MFLLVLAENRQTNRAQTATDLQWVNTCMCVFDETWPHAGTVWFRLKSCQTDRNPSPTPLSSLSRRTCVCVCVFPFHLSRPHRHDTAPSMGAPTCSPRSPRRTRLLLPRWAEPLAPSLHFPLSGLMGPTFQVCFECPVLSIQFGKHVSVKHMKLSRNTSTHTGRLGCGWGGLHIPPQIKRQPSWNIQDSSERSDWWRQQGFWGGKEKNFSCTEGAIQIVANSIWQPWWWSGLYGRWCCADLFQFRHTKRKLARDFKWGW